MHPSSIPVNIARITTKLFEAQANEGTLAQYLLTATGLSLATLACSPPVDAVFDTHPQVPTVVTAEWTTPFPAKAWIEYGLDGQLDQVTPPSDSCDQTHEMSVLGLKAGREYSMRAVAQSSNGTIVYGRTQTISLEPPPEDLPQFNVSCPEFSADDPEGFILTSTLGVDNGWAVIVDRDGDPVWFHKADGALSITTTVVGRDQKSILHSQYDVQQRTDLGGTVRINLADPEPKLTATRLAHHDFVELPDDRIGWIQLELGEASIDGETVPIASDRIVEMDEGSSDAESVIFSFLEDYEEPYPTCEHFYADAYGTGAFDWTHANSLMYDDEDDAYFLMSKNLDALFKIDRSSGSLVWQLGGDDTTLQRIGEGSDFHHAHMSHRWDGGILVFDNGYHKSPAQSRVVEYAIDENLGTYEQVWEYPDPSGRFVQLLGDAQRLPDGNTLISWSTAGLITEVNSSGDVVWQAETELGFSTGRVSWLRDLYRLQ